MVAVGKKKTAVRTAVQPAGEKREQLLSRVRNNQWFSWDGFIDSLIHLLPEDPEEEIKAG